MPARLTRRRRSRGLVAVVCSAIVVLVRPAAGGEPAVVGSLWFGSQDAVRGAADQVGLTLRPPFTTGVLEQSARLQPGDVRVDAPLGLLFLSADGLADRREQFGCALPLRPAAAPLDRLPGATWTDVADVVHVAHAGYVRRTPDYLIAGYGKDAVAKLDVARQTALLRPTPDGSRVPVLLAVFDAAAFRGVAPQTYARLLAAGAPAAGHEADAGQRSRAVLAAGAIAGLDRLSLSVDRTGYGWDVTGTVRPFRAAHASFARPGLPAWCVGRADVQVPVEVVFRAIQRVAAAAPPRVAAELPAIGQQFAAALVGDAETFGVGLAGGKPVLCCVTQRRLAGDLAAEVAAVADAASHLPPAAAADFTATTYAAADGPPVYRFALHDHGRVFGSLDVTARGGRRFATFSTDGGPFVDALVPLGPEAGSFDTLGRGWVRPGPIFEVLNVFAAAVGSHDLLSADQCRQLADLFGNARVSWTVDPDGPGATFNALLPASALGAIRPALAVPRR